jgi:predicted PurR-regulated permease PerM
MGMPPEDVSVDEGAPRGERTLPPLSHYAKATAAILAVILLAVVAWTARGVLLTVLIGFLLAAGLDPLVRALEQRGMRRGTAVLTILLAAVTAAVLMFWLGLRPAISQAVEFAGQLPELLNRLSTRFTGTGFADWLVQDEVAERLRSVLDDIAAFLFAEAGAIVGVLASVAGAVFSAFTIAAVTVYLMLALPRIKAFAGRALGDETRVGVLAEALRRVGGYVTGQLGICACAGVTSTIVFLILGVPYAALLGLIVAVLDAIPQVGATLGAVVATAVALTQSVGVAVAVVVFFVIYQQVENFLIAPRVFASAVSLSPITVFISVLLGGAIGGFIGVILALPIAAALKVIFRHVFREQLGTIEGRDVPDLLRPPVRRQRRRRRRVRRAQRREHPARGRR